MFIVHDFILRFINCKYFSMITLTVLFLNCRVVKVVLAVTSFEVSVTPFAKTKEKLHTCTAAGIQVMEAATSQRSVTKATVYGKKRK